MRSSQTPGEEDANERLANRTDSEKGRAPLGGAGAKPAPNGTGAASSQLRTTKMTETGTTTKTTITTTTESNENDDGKSSDKQLLDAECERLLRNTKRQVKQMMEEAVTKKFIHEESSSIISLCVAIDACLSHQLKRRALGLFKTNSSTALVRKIAKLCPEAQATISMVEEEERRQQEELKRQKKQQQQQAAANQARQKQQQQQQHQSTDGSGSRQRGAPNTGSFATQQHGSPVKQVASNLSVHRRNMWIKCALIEKRLVPIVEHLAANASKYYEPEALMSNYVSAQLLCSLLVGPCALEFSRSKTNDFYQFEEPSADELLKRHNLSNPIACLCSSSVSSLASHTSAHPSSSLRRFHGGSLNYRPPTKTMSTHHQHDDIHQHVSRSLSTSTTGGSAKLFRHHHPQNRNRLSADKDSSQSCTDGASGSLQQPEAAATSVTNTNTKTHTVGRLSRRRPSTASQSSLHELIQEEDHHHLRHASSPSSGSQLVRNSSGGSCGGAGSGASGGGGVSRRRRPLALRTNMKTGALVTECHHSACQEISEHQQTRGYSFTCALNPNGNQPQQSITAGRNLCNISSPLSQQRQESMGTQGLGGAGSGTSGGGGSSSADQQQQQQPGGAFNGGLQSQFNNANNNLDSTWPAWSPRMLHETLHQNSKSSLLYAKNNILLETHTHGTVAGYLSLHQTSAPDLIIKWIPNQLINGGHTQTQDTALCGNCRHQQVSSGDPVVQQTAKRHFQKNGTASATTSGPVVAEKSPEIGVATNRRLPGKRSASSNTAPTGEKCGVSEEAARSHSLTTSDALQQQQQQRKSKQANQSTTCHQDLSAIDQPHQQQDGLAGNLSRAIGSSYLDLVINLSVSRIVLLNCHFNGVPTSEFFTTPTEHFSPSSCANSGAGEQLDGDSGSGSGRGSDVGLNSDLEETLILVEADGVQRAPFRFPKGGLRWFLSCLENGLGPDRYLEPAIRPDNDEDDETTGGSSSGNTIEHSKRFADPLQMLHSPAGWMMANHNNGSDSPSTASEPAPGNNNSRLEVLLRRLPSLRRSQPNTKATVNSDNNKTRSVDITPSAAGSAGPPPTLEGGGPNQPHSSELNRGESPTPPSAGGTGNDLRETLSTQWKRPHYRPRNYVYRIVNVHHQFDWAQQTPPLSALSVDLGINGRPHANKRRQQQQHQMLSNDSPGVGQRFSWSLSKLARFSSRTNSTSSSSAGGGGGAGNGLAPANSTETTTGQSKSALGSLTSLLYLSYNKTTLDSVGSLDSSNQQATDLNNNSTDTGLASAMKRDSSSELIRIEAKLNDLKKSSTEELMVLRNQSIQTLCESMRKQILARAFYGWLVYCRRMKIVRTHLMGLINESRLRALNRTRGVAKSDEDEREIVEGLTRDDDVIIAEDEEELMEEARAFGLTWIRWRELVQAGSVAADQQGELSAASKRELARRVNLLVYYGGIEDDQLRAEVWPYLLGHYEFSDSPETRRKRDETCRSAFESSARDWIKIERVIKERDNQILEANMAKVARRQQRERLMAAGGGGEEPASPEQAANGFSSLTSETTDSTEMLREDEDEAQQDDDDDQDDDVQDDVDRNEQGQKGEDSTVREPGELKEEDDRGDDKREESSICQDTTTATTTTTTTITETDDRKETDDKTGDHDIERQEEIGARGKQRINKSSSSTTAAATKARAKRQRRMRRRFRLESTGSVGSDASITDQFGNNIHRIDKDVQRCDRNFWYFKNVDNLNKLRKIMCSYVWQHLDVGYVQGMCDLAAPLLVIFDHDELMAFNCFSQLMKRMVANFPHGSAMDQHFEHLKYLMQVLDPKLFEILQNNGDYTHFYFCYRWLLLDFKRELAYEDVYRVWEAIWSARVVATEHFVVFLALAMVRFYRDIIIENNMDFTDTIKFFNEMAERHDARKIIALAQDCVSELESLIES